LEAIEMALLEGRLTLCYNKKSAGKQGLFETFVGPSKRLLTAKSKVRVLVGELSEVPPNQRVTIPAGGRQCGFEVLDKRYMYRFSPRSPRRAPNQIPAVLSISQGPQLRRRHYRMSADAPLVTPTAAVDPALLPDDPAVLKQLVAQLCEEIREHAGRVEKLEHHVTLLLRRLYGARSEKVDPRQGVLFDEPPADDASPASDESTADLSANEPAHEDESVGQAESAVRPRRPGAHGRRKLPDSLMRVETIHDLSPAEKEAMGGAEQLVVIGRQVTEQLEWKPSSLFVIRHVQITYARREQLPESGLKRRTWSRPPNRPK
ncbi:MAG TPA: hypothetical protein VGN42_10415, partial [Pirellulales bacterium]|nr:hypothetical protein [Pirellulales bacterium]